MCRIMRWRWSLRVRVHTLPTSCVIGKNSWHVNIIYLVQGIVDSYRRYLYVPMVPSSLSLLTRGGTTPYGNLIRLYICIFDIAKSMLCVFIDTYQCIVCERYLYINLMPRVCACSIGNFNNTEPLSCDTTNQSPCCEVVSLLYYSWYQPQLTPFFRHSIGIWPWSRFLVAHFFSCQINDLPCRHVPSCFMHTTCKHTHAQRSIRILYGGWFSLILKTTNSVNPKFTHSLCNRT